MLYLTVNDVAHINNGVFIEWPKCIFYNLLFSCTCEGAYDFHDAEIADGITEFCSQWNQQFFHNFAEI